MRMRFTVFTFLIFVSATYAVLAQPDMKAGRRSYEVCAGCHGFVGEGNSIIGAPRLAGIESWYLDRQIQNFQAGRRGHVEGDAAGRRMARMVQAVGSERERNDILAWISDLPAAAPPGASAADATTADLSRGQSLYAVCAACHGTGGRGNEALGAPALVALDDWYFTEQLRLFAEGLRGNNPADTYGAQMRALASGFDTDDERRDLTRFVQSLRQQATAPGD